METTSDKLRAFFLALLLHLAIVVLVLLGMFWSSTTKPVTLPGPVIEAELVGVAQAPKVRVVNKTKLTPPAPVTPLEPAKPPEPDKAAPPPPPPPPKPTPEEIKRQQDAQAEVLRQDQQNRERVAEMAREKAEKADKAETERKRQEQILLEQKEQEEQAKHEQEIQKQLDAVKKQREAAEKKRKLEQEKLAQLADANQKPAPKPAATQRVAAAEVPEADKAQTGMNGEDNSLLAEYSAAIQNAVTLSWLRPDSAPTGLRCKIHITQIPGGDVLSANIVGACNADGVTRSSIEQAVKRAAPLPYKGFEKVFARDLELNFRYDG